MKDIGNYLGPALVAFLVPIILGWLLRSASAKAQRINGIAWLNYGVALKTFTLFFVGIVAALIAIWFNVELKDKNPVLFMIGLFGVLTLPMVIEFFLVRIGFDADGIYCYSGWRPKRTIGWAAVESVEFSQSMQWWLIRTRGSGKIRASVFLSGLQDFLTELERRGIKSTQ